MILPLSYRSLVTSVLSLLLLFVLVFPYIQAETLSNLNAGEFDINRVCRADINKDFRYLKIINYEPQKNTATVYCIYKDFTKNSIVTLYNSAEKQWLIEYTRNYKKDIRFYWPIYY
jgi:hypothetical protein